MFGKGAISPLIRASLQVERTQYVEQRNQSANPRAVLRAQIIDAELNQLFGIFPKAPKLLFPLAAEKFRRWRQLKSPGAAGL